MLRMIEMQKEMKMECHANNSVDLFDVTTTSDGGEAVIDDFLLANSMFTLPRLHEMMMVSTCIRIS